jgi:pimeloyl-ACP methyl ester carboxylesterase
VRSSHANALPLLLLPPFPFTNLSFAHLLKPFSDPEDAATEQPFHLVVPALPGLGFSDPLPNNTPVISTVADMLNTLMTRLSYEHYLVTNAGAATTSPAEIDWKLANHLAVHYPDACLGTHLISPPLASPKLVEAPLEWAKWSIANFFHVGILGYSNDDFSALKRAETSAWAVLGSDEKRASRRGRHPTPIDVGLNRFGLREPNTLAYALCDSPTGLLVFVIKALSLLGPKFSFTPDQLLTFAQLAWLPGPEYAMRFWASCAAHDEAAERRKRDKAGGGIATKPRVAITVFLGGEEEDTPPAPAPEATGTDAGVELRPRTSHVEAGKQVDLPPPMPHEEAERYTCPAWGKTHYDVVYSQRLPGRPGLLAWERPEVIVSGARSLAREILRLDRRLQPTEESQTAGLAQVIVPEDSASNRATTPKPEPPPPQSPPLQEPGPRGALLSSIVEEPITTHEPEVPPPQVQLSPAETTTKQEPDADHPALIQEPEEIGSSSTLDVSKEKGPDVEKGKEEMIKEPDLLAPPAPAFLAEKHVDSFSSGGSPTTLIDTPPLELASRPDLPTLPSQRTPEPSPS